MIIIGCPTETGVEVSHQPPPPSSSVSSNQVGTAQDIISVAIVNPPDQTNPSRVVTSGTDCSGACSHMDDMIREGPVLATAVIERYLKMLTKIYKGIIRASTFRNDLQSVIDDF